MDEYQRCKIRLYQYLMARGDSLKSAYESALYVLKSKKHLTRNDIENCLRAINDYEAFERFYREILEYI